MATFNISYHHSIIHYNVNNSRHLCPILQSLSFKKPLIFPRKKLHNRVVSAMASGSVKETLPPALDSSSDPPAIFDGTPKLYISYSCPYAQRVWITRNCKGLQETIKLVPIDLKNRPAWYKEKVYPENKVPSLEHNNEVKGESLDLIRYIDSNFEGPLLFPDDPAKREFGEELLDYTGSFYKAVTTSFKESKMDEAVSAFDHIETALSKFDEGPFFLGKFSLVDVAYIPFVERFQAFLSEVKNYDITRGRPRLAVWIEEMNKIEAYKQTQRDPKEHVESYRKRFLLKAEIVLSKTAVQRLAHGLRNMG
ncbi:UNVERIFIED_CONTAM: Glutathione S-transferase L1 [Sesamum indicum]